MKKTITTTLLALFVVSLAFGQKDSALKSEWNVPQKRNWFIEIGTPGIGYTLKSSNNGILTDNINTSNSCTKILSLSLYFKDKSDTTSSFYTGFGEEYSGLGGTFSIDDNLKKIDPSWSTMSIGVGWSVTSLKFKSRSYAKINRSLSLSFGFGISYNKSSLDGFNIWFSEAGQLKYYEIPSVTTESYNFVADLGVNWDIKKWFSIGARLDYDGSYKIKINKIASIYGEYDAFSNANFITLSPTVRFKF